MFISPTYGKINLNRVVQISKDYISNSEVPCEITVGSDSHVFKKCVVYISVVSIHSKGRGAIYFYQREETKRVEFHERIFSEVNRSIELAKKIETAIGIPIIHIDVGHNGKTRDLINAAKGMVTGCGFEARIKPESCIASTVADKHSKYMS